MYICLKFNMNSVYKKVAYVFIICFIISNKDYGQVVLLNDDFSSWPQGWRDTVIIYGSCSPGGCGRTLFGNCCQSSYIINQDGANGNPAPSAHIYNDQNSFGVSVMIRKNVNVAICTGNLILSFDYRAASSTSVSSVTNAVLWLYDAGVDTLIFSTTLVAGGTTNTGWQSYSIDLTSIVQDAGVCDILIGLGTNDGWVTDWDKQVWFDNVRLECTTGGGAAICVSLPYLPSIQSIRFIPPSFVDLEWTIETTEPIILERGLDPTQLVPIDTIWEVSSLNHTYHYLDQLSQLLSSAYFYRYRLLYSNVTSSLQALFLQRDPSSFTVFPNPTNGHFSLWSSHKGSFELLDFTGKILRVYEKEGTGIMLIREALPSGMYYLRERETGKQVRLIVIE